MCQIESVVHVACRHWGKDRFFGEPCPRARKVKNGALLACSTPPEGDDCSVADQSGLLPEAIPSQSHNNLQRSSCTQASTSAWTTTPVYERSKAIRDIQLRQCSTISTMTAAYTRSRSNSSDSGTSSANSDATSCSTTSILSDFDIRRMQTGYYSPNGAYIPAAEPLLDEDVTDSSEQPDEYVYLPCLYARNVGCANGDGQCPRCAVPRVETSSLGQLAALVQPCALL